MRPEAAFCRLPVRLESELAAGGKGGVSVGGGGGGSSDDLTNWDGTKKKKVRHL